MSDLIYFKKRYLDTFKHDLQYIFPVFFSDSPIAELEKKYDCTLKHSLDFKIPEISLLDNKGNCVSDLEAVKQVYGNMKKLPSNIASEECIWSALCLSENFWPYVRKRWNFSEMPKNDKAIDSLCKKIRNRLFFGKSPYTRHAIARLWWIGKMTFDESLENPYYLTALIIRNSDFVVHIFERAQGANLKLVRNFCLRLIELQDNSGLKINSALIRALLKYINACGGSILIDSIADNINPMLDSFLGWYNDRESAILY